ncbi:MAG: hypothetical protein ABFQ82_04540 [Thermodesulfobacteriota bacterium]
MKKTSRRPAILAVILFLSFFLPTSSFARDRLASFDLEVNGAKRTDQFDWNIAYDTIGTSPNTLSELTWKDLEINEINTKAKIVMVNNKVPFGGMVKASAHYGEIISGENQDSDYGTDNRTGEWSRSNNQSDRGDVFGLQVGGGVVFMSSNKMFSMAPHFGYSFHLQYLTIHDGYQTISEINPFGGSNPPAVGTTMPDLNSTYDAEWQTGFVGLDLEFTPSPHFEIYGVTEFHAGQYEAEADWNLRTDFRHPISFTHESEEAIGIVARGGIRIGWKNILLNGEVRYRKFKAEDGIDKTYFDDGTIGVTKVNEVNWESVSVGGGITVRF